MISVKYDVMKAWEEQARVLEEYHKDDYVLDDIA